MNNDIPMSAFTISNSINQRCLEMLSNFADDKVKVSSSSIRAREPFRLFIIIDSFYRDYVILEWRALTI